MKTGDILLCCFGILALTVGCKSNGSSKPSDENKDDSLEVERDSHSDVSSDSELGKDECGTEIDMEKLTGDVAIDEDFDDWVEGNCDFLLSNGEGNDYEDNGTKADVDGHDCLVIHANTGPNSGNGYSAELQLMLDGWTDMSHEDFRISFDIYVPSETHKKGANVQFGFRETIEYTPIYSKWWSSSLKADQWVTIESDITTQDGFIDYTDFKDNPGDWKFNAVRIQFIVNGASAQLGDELLFYIDNVVVERRQDDTDPKDTDETGSEPEENSYSVTIDGKEVPVERMPKFEVPVSYVRHDFTGDSMTIDVVSNDDITDYAVHPTSRNVASSSVDNRLSLTVNEPMYLLLEIEEGERLFIFIDPEEENPPKPGDSNVVNLKDSGGMDNTGKTEVTDIIQASVDAASGSKKNVVYIPKGLYLTDTIYLRDDMTLYLADGAVLKNAVEQSTLMTHPEGLAQIEYCSRGLIVMDGVRNAKLMGRGTLDGNGVELHQYKRKEFLVKIEESRDCVIDGIVSRDSPFWNTLVFRSKDITIENYKVINNQRKSGKADDDTWNETDGVDFNNCVDSTLYNAFLYTGDDCMAVKSDDVPDEIAGDNFRDPASGEYMNVDNLRHEKVVCSSGSSGAKVGTKTFGESMNDIVFKDIDIINARRALVIDAVDTAHIDGTRFEDIRIEKVSGDILDFNMDPEEIDWRANLGTCTVTNTIVKNVASEQNASCHIMGNIHDYNKKDEYYGNEYYIDGVAFTNFVIADHVITGIDDGNIKLNLEYAKNITFEP